MLKLMKSGSKHKRGIEEEERKKKKKKKKERKKINKRERKEPQVMGFP